MKPDAYTKFILTVIALCLVVLAWGTLDRAVAPEAHAQVGAIPTAGAETVSCNVSGKGYKKCLPVIMGH